MKLSAFLALAISALSFPSMAMEATNGAGVFGQLPRDVRSLIYQCLDEVTLAKLERTSATMDNDIEATEQWKRRALWLEAKRQRATNHPVDYKITGAGEAHCKLVAREGWLRIKVKHVFYNKPHGLEAKDLFFAGFDFSASNYCNFQYVDFSGANLEGAGFSGAQLFDCSFAGANLRGADLSGCFPAECSFENADLSGANVKNAKIWVQNFRNANLNGVNLLEARSISESDFRGADLRETGLTRRILKLEEAKFDSKTKFSESFLKETASNLFRKKPGKEEARPN